MGFIYIVTNLANGKKYVGITSKTIEERWDRHIYDATIRQDDFYFHRAIRKYGIDNFIIEKVEECSNDVLGDREKFYIQHFDTFYKNNKGYNLTLGGDGLSTIDYDRVLILWEAGLSAKEIAIILDVNSVTICRFLHRKNISSEEIKSRGARFACRNSQKKIYQYNFDGELINIYSSAAEASSITGYNKDYISAACRKVYPSANGYIWTYDDKETDIQVLINQVPVNNRTPVYQYNSDGKLVQEFASISEASQITGIDKTAISHAANEKNKILTAKGFFWSKEKETEENIAKKISKYNSRYDDRKKKILQYDKKGNFIAEHESITSAAKTLGKDSCRSAIAKVCQGKQKTSCGFIWKYST